jgi:hypothetical protein
MFENPFHKGIKEDTHEKENPNTGRDYLGGREYLPKKSGADSRKSRPVETY